MGRDDWKFLIRVAVHGESLRDIYQKPHEQRAAAVCSIYFAGTDVFNSSLQFVMTTMFGMDV